MSGACFHSYACDIRSFESSLTEARGACEAPGVGEISLGVLERKCRWGYGMLTTECRRLRWETAVWLLCCGGREAGFKQIVTEVIVLIRWIYVAFRIHGIFALDYVDTWEACSVVTSSMIYRAWAWLARLGR